MNLRTVTGLISRAVTPQDDRGRSGVRSGVRSESNIREGTLLPAGSFMDDGMIEDVGRLVRFSVNSARRYPVQVAVGVAGLMLLAGYLARKQKAADH